MRSGDFKETYSGLIVLSDSTWVWIWSALLAAALVCAPFVLNAYALSLLTLVLITLIGALGLNILTGLTGLISLGHVGFLVVGAYAYAIAVTKHGLPPLAGFAASGLVAALASVIVGVPSLRLRGLYLAITTLAFSFIINNVILEAAAVTDGARGISVLRPTILGIDFDSDAAFALLCLAVTVLTLFACLNIRRSRIGRALVAIRDNDTAARTMGVNLVTFKLYAFVTSAFITGIAGALLGIYLSFVSVEGFPFLLSIEALAILIVGGLGSVLGVVLGTVFIILLPEVVQTVLHFAGSGVEALFANGVHELKAMLYGVVIILFLRFEPRGLVGIWHDVKRLWVHWPLRF
ncbi:branched-chain amino acid ABC transporter permease [Chelatococcus reniformis]|uniref:Branched-chain amino acid ABC transporter permease n=1 Tax=Chelatococcus reniformis TaxID=1494448 RepID=A0A916UJ40_9HYPH|nr:branched-chain amino acid ABC transporter permease [Chelatococcus reniformis]GGC74807.1 branched-chain amino acid ABC transporter permease [Chelatococcus reniformis]